MKGNLVAIVTSRENVAFQNENIFIFSTNHNGGLKSKSVGKKKLSGMVPLYLAKYQLHLGEKMYKCEKKESFMLQMC